MANSSKRHASADLATRQPTATDPKRRRFLLALGAGGAGAAAAVTQAATAPLLPAVAAPVSAPSTSGYHETQHIRDYYATTRL